MISPELLRRYTFFATIDNEYLKQLAMIASTVTFEQNSTLFEEGKPADKFFLIIDGNVDLFMFLGDIDTGQGKMVSVGEVSVGEPINLSSLFDPFISKTTATTRTGCTAISASSKDLLELFDTNPNFAYFFMRQLSITILNRLHSIRNQVAAARE